MTSFLNFHAFAATRGEETHDKGSFPEPELTEEQFLEQFAALEEGLALLQIHMRSMSENAKLFGSLARHMRRSICPTTLSPQLTDDFYA